MSRKSLPWAGFHPLRAGRIHVYCWLCGRKVSNSVRGEYDPPRAELVQTPCERCGAGGKDTPETFLDGRGKEIPWEEIERHIEAVVSVSRVSRP